MHYEQIIIEYTKEDHSDMKKVDLLLTEYCEAAFNTRWHRIRFHNVSPVRTWPDRENNKFVGRVEVELKSLGKLIRHFRRVIWQLKRLLY